MGGDDGKTMDYDITFLRPFLGLGRSGALDNPYERDSLAQSPRHTHPRPSMQTKTPLLTQLQLSARSSTAPFHTPGHHKGTATPDILKSWLGPEIFRADLPELPELDNLFAPEGPIAQAQDLAAAAWNADRTYFLTNGSTAGILAAILTVCNPGDAILVPRNVHRSVISGMILSGANPVFVIPTYDDDLDIVHGIDIHILENTLNSNPNIKSILIVSPTYYGVCSDIQAIAKLAHDRNLPLIVDEAHGAHFGFHPDLPKSALHYGADLVIQSTHKTLSAFTQASMLHQQGDRINLDRLSQSLALIQSSSPNYLLLASLDAARMQMATQGEMLLGAALKRVESVRSHLTQIPGLRLLNHDAIDPLRLTINVANLGIDGFTADEILHTDYGVTCELPSAQNLTFIFTHGTTDEDCDRLIESFKHLATRPPTPNSGGAEPTQRQDLKVPLFKGDLGGSSIPTQPTRSVRDAFFAPTQTLPTEQAIGQLCADLLCPYPPGIPLLLPGEPITADILSKLNHILQSGGTITGLSDPTFQTLRVLTLRPDPP